MTNRRKKNCGDVMSVSKNEEKSIGFEIQSQETNLSRAEQKVYDYLRDHATTETFLRVGDLAAKAEVSEATVVRFCKKIGYSGFLEFKNAVLQERLRSRVELSPYPKITVADTSRVVLEKVFAITLESLTVTMDSIDRDAFDQVVSWLAAADLIELYAHGGSGHVAQNAAIQYQRQGIRCVVLTDPVMHSSAILKTTQRDVVVGISHTGETSSVVHAIHKARERGLRTCAITHYPQSSLAKSAEVVLSTAANSTAILSDAGSSRISQMAILDAIGVAVSLRKQDIE